MDLLLVDMTRSTDYVSIYRRMISADVRDVELSGMRHDTLAGVDVYQDAFGSVLSTLERGFVFDGYLKLYLLLSRTLDTTTPNRAAFLLREVVGSILPNIHVGDAWKRQGFEDDKTPTKLEKTLEVIVDYVRENGVSKYLHYPVDGSPTTEIDITSSHDNRVVIQPADIYRELFKRLKDLLPKFISINRAIIPGTINAEKAK